ncbi:MAG TPA: hypothetical protein VKA06_12095 [Spirochaetia bacterium]|nr:hypothetical protein [Spirochaetia bacterium]
MELLAGTVVGLERSVPNLSAEAFNLYEHGGMVALAEALESVGLELLGVSFPLLIVGDEVHEGEAAVRAEIERLRGCERPREARESAAAPERRHDPPARAGGRPRRSANACRDLPRSAMI